MSEGGKNAWDIAMEVSRQAGGILMHWWPKTKQVFNKGLADIVTNVDRECEDFIRGELKNHFPSHGTFGEEGFGDDPNEGWVWVIDPIDGTRNFAAGIPHFSIVVALVKDGDVVVGVNYDPIHGEMFHAAIYQGAFLNDKKIRVSNKLKLEDVSCGFDPSNGPAEGTRSTLQVLRKLWPHLNTTRTLGSSALGLSYVAAGRTDIYINHRLQPYDQAAGLVLVEEAGGIVTDRQGYRAGLYSDGIIASSSPLHKDFMDLTKSAPWRRPSSRANNPREA